MIDDEYQLKTENGNERFIELSRLKLGWKLSIILAIIELHVHTFETVLEFNLCLPDTSACVNIFFFFIVKQV